MLSLNFSYRLISESSNFSRRVQTSAKNSLFKFIYHLFTSQHQKLLLSSKQFIYYFAGKSNLSNYRNVRKAKNLTMLFVSFYFEKFCKNNFRRFVIYFTRTSWSVILPFPLISSHSLKSIEVIEKDSEKFKCIYISF